MDNTYENKITSSGATAKALKMAVNPALATFDPCTTNAAVTTAQPIKDISEVI
jgi:hypothetical protein